MFCVSTAAIKRCSDIKLNSAIQTDDGRKESCNDASQVFKFSNFECVWTEGYNNYSGSCCFIYYLTKNGM
jgi:hypothetical protein